VTKGSHSISPSATIEVISSPNDGASPLRKSIFAGIASFGSDLPFGNPNLPSLPVILAPSNNPLMCEEVDVTFASDNPIIILVPRGECSFEMKTRNAERLGAIHTIIYDNLAAKYGEKVPFSQSLEEVIWPNKTVDYECELGEAWIPKTELNFNRFPYDTSNDVLLSGSASNGNLCALYNDVEAELRGKPFENFKIKCPSQHCLLTGNRNIESELMQACCAWDISFDMGDDDTLHDVNITSTLLTMAEGNVLVKMVQNGEVQALFYLRWFPKYNISSLLICALGTFVTWLAGWLSAKPYRDFKRKLEDDIMIDINDCEDPPSQPASSSPMKGVIGEVSNCPPGIVNGSNMPANTEIVDTSLELVETEEDEEEDTDISLRNDEHVGDEADIQEEEILDLKLRHALIFIVAASSMLFILFFTKLYDVVTVFYVIGGVTSMIQVMIRPWLLFLCHRCRPLKLLVRPILQKFLNVSVCAADLLSVAGGILIGSIWLWLSFTKRNSALSIPFYWVVQDIMGACVCIAFLSVIRLNSIKVATFLLGAAFVYDIFFVFITPHLFGESIMVTVATGGGQEQDPHHCEKYPSEGDCNNTPLPMLFAIPRINDWRGGLSMLGLGDIVLPGLICCFAARLDAAKDLMNSLHAGESSQFLPTEKYICTLFSGYFPSIIIAYAMGLILANIAVYLMKHAQPALLYLVPLILCTMVLIGSINSEVRDLWKGPKRLEIADEVHEKAGASAFHESGEARIPTEVGLRDGELS